jgi:hypothetical protein
VDHQDPVLLGGWIRQQLRTAGFPKAPVVIAIARQHVGLKRMQLPSTDPDELPRMTRLALQRELPFEADDAIIDFVPTQDTSSSTSVLAVAAPCSVIDFVRQTVRAAGLSIERIGLRAMGAAVLAGGDAAETGETMIVDITGEGIEFCVVRDGVIQFSRGAEMSGSAAQNPAETILTETRRTWMSYRIVEESGGLDQAIILGDRSQLAPTAQSISEMLRVPAKILEHHPRIEAGVHDVDRLWPLAGMLLESPTQRETINFAQPRRATDRVAQRRRRVVLAAAIVVVMLAGLWTFSRRDLQNLQNEQTSLKETRSQLAPEHARYFRDRYRLAHLEKWEDSQVRWLVHAAYVATMVPAADQVVLDSWTGSLDFPGVRFDRENKSWSTPRLLTITVDGDARDRTVADAFREALVGTELYNTSSTGSDAESGRRLPFGFTYRLETAADAPEAAPLLGGATK